MPINLRSKSLPAALFLTTLLTLFAPALLPSLSLRYFAPFLVFTFYQRPLPTALFYAFFCGLLLDLLAANRHLGLYSLNFCLATAFLYRRQRHFFADSVSTLFVMTVLFSALSTALEFLLHTLFERQIPLSSLAADLIFNPLSDGLFAFLFFTLPDLALKKALQPGHHYR